jgi:aspartate/glutamate racemase
MRMRFLELIEELCVRLAAKEHHTTPHFVLICRASPHRIYPAIRVNAPTPVINATDTLYKAYKVLELRRPLEFDSLVLISPYTSILLC